MQNYMHENEIPQNFTLSRDNLGDSPIITKKTEPLKSGSVRWAILGLRLVSQRPIDRVFAVGFSWCKR